MGVGGNEVAVKVGAGRVGVAVGVQLGVRVGAIVAVAVSVGDAVGVGGQGHGLLTTITITTITQTRQHKPPKTTVVPQARQVHRERSQSLHPAGVVEESGVLVSVRRQCSFHTCETGL